MKIHIINTFYPPWRGGAETYTKSLAENLAKLGHDVKVTVANQPLASGEYLQNGVSVTRLKSAGMFYGVPITPCMLNRLLSVEADVIHVNFPNPYNAALGALASRIKSLPAVLTWHNDLPPVTRIAGALVRIHDDLATRFYLNEYDAIVTTSNFYAEGSKILKRFKEKTRLIPNGVDCEKFNPNVPGEDLNKRLNLGYSKVALFVGALTKWHRYKGLDDLLRAFKLLNRDDFRLLVVGGGDLKPKYETLAGDLGLQGKVLFVGEVPDSLLPNYYAASDVLILPSKDRSEGFGLTILEANASGIPAIASNTGGIPGILVDGRNGMLVPPNDPLSLAEAIRRIAEDDDMLRKLGVKAREVALDHDWRKVALETEKLYSELIHDS
jgi:glycosyltransferase involved in cell wall biosynthesis